MNRLGGCLAAAVLLLTGCSGPAGTNSPKGSSPLAARRLTVLAAASLRESFDELGKSFTTANPGVEVVTSYGGSSDLAQQIVNGSPADVFAAASPETMRTVVDANLVDGQPATFATNKLEIAVPPGNPKHIGSFADLAKDGVLLVVCARQVPCGAATRKVETATGSHLRPASEEPDVKSVLGKVAAGEADAGLVYVTDVSSAGSKVTGVPFAEADQAVNTYPIGVIRSSANAELARRFLDLVRGEVGKRVLRKAGFVTP